MRRGGEDEVEVLAETLDELDGFAFEGFDLWADKVEAGRDSGFGRGRRTNWSCVVPENTIVSSFAWTRLIFFPLAILRIVVSDAKPVSVGEASKAASPERATHPSSFLRAASTSGSSGIAIEEDRRGDSTSSGRSERETREQVFGGRSTLAASSGGGKKRDRWSSPSQCRR